MKLVAGQSSALIRFRPTVAGPKTFTIQGFGDPFDVKLNDADNTAEFPWSQSTAPTDTVLLLVQTKHVPIVQLDTVYILPATPALQVQIQKTLVPYVWLRNQWNPLTLRIGVGPGELTREECEQVRFSLQAIPDGDVAPDTGRATYEEGNSPYNCFVLARWKLAEVTGRQDLGVRVGNEFVRVRGVAREGPRIVAGLAYFTRHTDEEKRYCLNYTQAFDTCNKDRQSFADTVARKNSIIQEKAWEPFFAVEAPVIVWRQPALQPFPWIHRHLRVVAGSSFDKPMKNLFLGLTISPIIYTELESLPIQAQVAWRVNGGFVGGLSVDGSGLLSNALKALGAPF